MPSGQQDHYETLGVPRTAAAGEIRKAHRKLVRQYHPDLNPGDKLAEERFKRVQQAYEVLIDPKARRTYDQTAFKPEAPPTRTPAGTARGGRPHPATDAGPDDYGNCMYDGPSGAGGPRGSGVPPRDSHSPWAFESWLSFLVACNLLTLYGAIVKGRAFILPFPHSLGLGGLWVVLPVTMLFIMGLVFGRTRGSFLVGSTLINAAVWGSLIVYSRESLRLPWPEILHMWPWVLPAHLVIMLGAACRRGDIDWIRAIPGTGGERRE